MGVTPNEPLIAAMGHEALEAALSEAGAIEERIVAIKVRLGSALARLDDLEREREALRRSETRARAALRLLYDKARAGASTGELKALALGALRGRVDIDDTTRSGWRRGEHG